MHNVMNEVKLYSMHNHSYDSFIDAIPSPEEVVEQAYNLGYKAVSLSEHGNMHSVIRGYKKAKELGIKYIPACEVYETTDMKWKDADSDRYHLLLIAKNNTGYVNLNKIVTEGCTRGKYSKMRVDLETINQHSEGIIATSACLASRLMRLLTKGFCPCCGLGNQEHKDDCTDESEFEPKWDEAIKEVERYKLVFGDDFYIELQSHDTHDQTVGNQRILELARRTNTKIVVTFDSHMLDGSEKTLDIHRKFIQIASSREVGETYTDCYQQDMETLHSIMDKQVGADVVNEAILNTSDIADQCDFDLELHQDLMPKISFPDEFSSEQDYLKHLVRIGWRDRGLDKLSSEDAKIYKERVQKEFEVLDYLGYCSYFIMLSQLINKIRERNIPLGYSRGSGANCLILYILGVTEVDSIRWDLDFARFANKGRKGSAADYDIDISKERRQEVLDIAIELFGEANVSQVSTFNSLSPKVCIKDLGKVFEAEGIYKIPYSVRDKISKLVPDDANKKMTIERALESSDELRKYEQKFPLLFEYTKTLQNLPKSVGCHAAAVIISPEPIVNYSPLMYNKNGNLMMHLDMYNSMDDLGLVKMDFLGLNTLDVINNTLRLSELNWDDIDLRKLNLDDNRVFEEIYQAGSTQGIFQMESYVAQNMFKEMKPDTINDVFAVNAMNRPAVLDVGMDKEYIYNKNHQNEIKYLHDDLKQVLETTYGIMIYQEQALKVFEVAGFPEDERDIARRAIGKKKLDVMESLYEKFKDGLTARGWNEDMVAEMWRLIEAQAGYSFNLGHSTAYGLLSYVTAWLKLYYPAEFMTSLLISEIGDYSQTTKYIDECKKMGIKVLPPHINKSNTLYTTDNGDILFGLKSIKGVGEKAADFIVEERNNKQFNSFEDFYKRMHGNSLIDVTTFVSLIKSGAFGQNKDEMLTKHASLTFDRKAFKPVKTIPTEKKMNELGLISTKEEFKNKERCLELYNQHKEVEHNKTQDSKWEKHLDTYRSKYMVDKDMYEFETLSIFLTDSPLKIVEQYIAVFEDQDDDATCLLFGTISNIKRKKQKNGRTYAYIELLTRDGVIEGTVFNHQYTLYQSLIEKGSNVVIIGRKSGGQFTTSRIFGLREWVDAVADTEVDTLQINERILFDMEYFGHTDVVDEEASGKVVVLIKMNTNFNPRITSYKVKTGEVVDLRIHKDKFFSKDNGSQLLNVGDMIELVNYEMKPKKKKVDGGWVDLPEKEPWLNGMKFVKRIKDK